MFDGFQYPQQLPPGHTVIAPRFTEGAAVVHLNPFSFFRVPLGQHRADSLVACIGVQGEGGLHRRGCEYRSAGYSVLQLGKGIVVLGGPLDVPILIQEAVQEAYDGCEPLHEFPVVGREAQETSELPCVGRGATARVGGDALLADPVIKEGCLSPE